MTLYLLPNVLGPTPDHHDQLPLSVDAVMSLIDGLIVESMGEGRRFLKRFKLKKKPHEIPLAQLNEPLDFLLEPILQGQTWGLVSDAGLPCLADPGALVVKRARELKITIKALSGPSSIFLALMQSGLPGQRFIFHGYIPQKPEERKRALKSWEKMQGYTHLFIEAPYRNLHTLESCLEALQDKTEFTIASALTLPEEWVYTDKISNWRKKEQSFSQRIAKTPTIFLFFSP